MKTDFYDKDLPNPDPAGSGNIKSIGFTTSLTTTTDAITTLYTTMETLVTTMTSLSTASTAVSGAAGSIGTAFDNGIILINPLSVSV